MKLDMSGDGFKLYELDSESELQEYVSYNDGITIGKEIQTKNKFYIVEFLTAYKKKVIGILNEGHGLRPIIIKLGNKNEFVLSSDKSVYLFEFYENRLKKSIICESLVFDIMLERNIFIVCELGIQCMTYTGKIIWTYNCDVITDFTFYDSYVRVVTGETEHLISLESGKEI